MLYHIKVISKMIQLIMKIGKKNVCFVIAICFCTSMMYPVILELNYFLIDYIENHLQVASKTADISMASIGLLILLILIASSIFQITRYSNLLLFEKMQVKVGITLMKSLYKKVSAIPHAFFDNPEKTAKLQRITLFSQDSMLTQNMVHLISAICNIISLLLVFPVLYRAGIEMFFVIFVIALVNNFFNFNEGKIRWELQQKLEKDNRRKEKIENHFRDKNSVLEMKLLGNKSFIEEKWIKLEADIFTKSLETNQSLERKKMLYGMIQILLNCIPLFIITLKYSEQSISLAIVFLVWQAQGQFNNIMSSVFNELKAVYFSIEYIDELCSFLEKDEFLEEEWQAPNKEQYYSNIIEMKHVSFGYTEENIILKDINLNLKQGEKIAVIGVNGAGKTSLIKLLTGLYRPQEGKVIFYPPRLKSDGNYFGSFCGVVWQDYVNFELSVRENIGFGSVENLHNDDGIKDVLNSVELDEYAERLDVALGKSFDMEGIIPSGGQWQKIAIGRALFGDKYIIYMDEPTASLDPISEVNIYTEVNRLFQDKTVIFVSHRIGFANLADRILVVSDGQVVEDGTHDDLISRKGFYHMFYNEQIKWYEGV